MAAATRDTGAHSAAVGATKATILSAYRTAETNAMLARTTFGVAEHSQHVVGRALDLRLESRLCDAMTKARAMQRGGVGWYPHSGFIHIDTGPDTQLASRRGKISGSKAKICCLRSSLGRTLGPS